jgi:L-malate glycosyltransferase
MVHAHQYTPFFYGAVGRWLGRRTLPVLFTEHGRHFPDVPRRRRMVANRFLLGRCDRVVGVGQAVRRALIENEGIAADRVGVVYNGIPLERFEEPPGTRAAVRAELGIEPDVFVAILVGRLDYLKDHATAIRAWHEVARERPDAVLLLVGEGPERAGIEAEIQSLGLGNRVRLLGLRTDVPRLLAAADVGLLTSISEGIPLTLIEAMATGLPVVSTDVGGVREIVVEDETGLLAPAGNHEELARHLIALASDPDRRTALGRQGKKRAHAVFSERTMHEHYRQIYDDLLRSR